MPRAYYKPRSIIEQALTFPNFKIVYNGFFILYLSCTFVTIFAFRMAMRSNDNMNSTIFSQYEHQHQIQQHDNFYDRNDAEHLGKANANNLSQNKANVRFTSEQEWKMAEERRRAFIPPQFPA